MNENSENENENKTIDATEIVIAVVGVVSVILLARSAAITRRRISKLNAKLQTTQDELIIKN